MDECPMADDRPNGPVVAALLAAGIGCALIGVTTVVATASTTVKDALNWWNPAGPLTGRTGVGTILFFIVWPVLHSKLRGRTLDFARAARVSLILLAIGLIGTFPPVFNFFAAE